jgi:hypothetical protein
MTVINELQNTWKEAVVTKFEITVPEFACRDWRTPPVPDLGVLKLNVWLQCLSEQKYY